MKQTFFFAIIFAFFLSCDGGQTKKPQTNDATRTTGTAAVNPKEKQLNVSIFLDLSDRISLKLHPQQVENDLELVKTITEYFRKNMEKLGAYKAKGKIKIFFSPPPSVPSINAIANSLKIDCSTMNNIGRKQVYDNLTSLFSDKLSEIYQQTMATSGWEGSDIWRFFKNDVKDYCIDKNTDYRNILIIFTDGYVYHKNSVSNKGNRFSYILEKNIATYRSASPLKELLEKDDFGLLVERNDLENLEVLVLEVCAENPANKNDEDIIGEVLKKWFKEMQISHFEVYSTDLPSNTRTRIDNFLNQ
jgi:hypothetical protein